MIPAYQQKIIDIQNANIYQGDNLVLQDVNLQGVSFEFDKVSDVPLQDGRWGACRVLRKASAEQAKQFGGECVLVASSAWVGEQVPSTPDPALRPIEMGGTPGGGHHRCLRRDVLAPRSVDAAE